MTCVLPRDLLEEVLVRLPAEEVHRLRWVSKSWKTLIESPEFINLHLRRSSARSLISNVYHMYESRERSPKKICIMDCLEESINRMKATAKLYSIIFREGWLKNNFLCLLDGFLCIKGCCNGLVCVSHEHYGITLPRKVVLWNPCTRQILQLPAVVEDGDYTTARHSYGLGYDEGHDEYKVVRLVQFYDQDWAYQYLDIRVYSLKWNCWRKLLEFPYQDSVSLRWCHWCVLANGALHWCDYKATVIVAFNLTTEKFRVFDSSIVPTRQLLHFGVLNDCLCLSVSVPNGPNVGLVFRMTWDFGDFWIMKEYGVKDSWTKLVIKRPPPDPGVCYSRFCWMPVSFCSNKYIVLQNDRYLTRYDTENKLYDEVVVLDDVANCERMEGWYVFVPSLVMLPGATADETSLLAPWKPRLKHPRSRFRSLLPSCFSPRKNQGFI